MFQLTDTTAKIDSFNPRAEKHGEDNKPAGDLKISFRAHSAVLDQFDTTLRPFLFRKSDLPGEQQPLIEGDTLTALAKPSLAPLKLKEKLPGYRLAIGSGLDSGDPLVLTDVELCDFVIQPIQGGSVEIGFRAIGHPTEEQAGRLYGQIQNMVDITLTPPESSRQQQLAA